jgi:hypothetical protein
MVMAALKTIFVALPQPILLKLAGLTPIAMPVTLGATGEGVGETMTDGAAVGEDVTSPEVSAGVEPPQPVSQNRSKQPRNTAPTKRLNISLASSVPEDNNIPGQKAKPGRKARRYSNIFSSESFINTTFLLRRSASSKRSARASAYSTPLGST